MDLVLTSDVDLIGSLVIHCDQTDCPLHSDHFMITFDISCTEGGLDPPSCLPSTIVFDYSKADWEGLCNYLLDQDFSLCYEESDVEIVWSVIKTIVVAGMDNFIPKVRLQNQQFPKWSTSSLRHQ